MMTYLEEVKSMSTRIRDFMISQIPREVNQKADALANLASTFEFISDRSIPLEFLPSPSIDIAKTICQAEIGPTQIDDIITYLQDGTLPTDKFQACRIQYRAAKFCLIQGVLYKPSFSGPLLRCLQPEEANYVFREIHEGICENHYGVRSLVSKVVRQGYFCPQMKQNAITYTRKCDKCQRFALVSHLPHTEMVPMTSPWPFAQ